MEMWNLQELYMAKANYENLISSEENQTIIDNIQEKINDIDEEISRLKNEQVLPKIIFNTEFHSS
jgi:hypothetical protein